MFRSRYFLRKGYCSSARSSSYLSSCASTGAATHTAHHSPLSSGADTPHTPLTGRTVADSGTRAAPSAQRRPGAVRRAGERRCGARTHRCAFIRIAHAPCACHAPWSCAHARLLVQHTSNRAWELGKAQLTLTPHSQIPYGFTHFYKIDTVFLSSTWLHTVHTHLTPHPPTRTDMLAVL